MVTSNDPEQLISHARLISSQYDEAKEHFAQLGEDRIAAMNQLRDCDPPVSWAQIGRIFNISPQAAMYVTGHIKRTPAKAGGAKKKATKKKS